MEKCQNGSWSPAWSPRASVDLPELDAPSRKMILPGRASLIELDGKHAVAGLDLAVRIALWRDLAEPEALQQMDRARIARVDGGEQRPHRELACQARKDGPAGFERDSTSPMLRGEDESEIRGRALVHRRLDIARALSGPQPDDPVEPALAAVGGAASLEARVTLLEGRNRCRRPTRYVVVDHRCRHHREHLVGVRCDQRLQPQR